MANTYSQIYLQFVFSVKYRQSLIPKIHKEELHKYITGLVHHRNSKLLAVHCMPDHAHIFVGFKPALSISDFVKEIKNESNEFINERKWSHHKFSWQEGYGVFSYSQSHINAVVKYIKNQHHKKCTFQEEYCDFLEKFEIPFEDRYLFEFFDGS
ncbi:IS200/IS605 family transposase [Dyadobacter sp. CY323]|uniref:IS200/IS605 family transposase n=1 Tax=Dyadobacter sp. CY323 TaxID=2907302 RepID=UPI001F436CAE|nr:IS200/IS605 family transposase [Dyadobacter sp. CY323]MCE6990893.1 IS200/IS605 family transposase [Dyadobacter sp. CY323]